jgi:hypothetical protein
MVKKSLEKIDPSLVYTGSAPANITINNTTDTTDLTPLESQISTLSGQITSLELQVQNLASLQSPMQYVASTGSTLSDEDITALSFIRWAAEGLFIEMKAVFTDMVTFTREVVFESIVTFKDRVFFEARVAFSDPDMAGRANIGVGMQRVHIEFEKSYDTPPIVTISPVGHYVIWAVKNLTEEGFDIEVSSAVTTELQFHWIALLVTGASDTSSQAQTSHVENVPVPANTEPTEPIQTEDVPRESSTGSSDQSWEETLSGAATWEVSPETPLNTTLSETTGESGSATAETIEGSTPDLETPSGSWSSSTETPPLVEETSPEVTPTTGEDISSPTTVSGESTL